MESLQLKTKLLYLLSSVAVGLVVVGFVGYFNLMTMKKNVDTLYFGSLIPLNELSSINSAYHHELESSVYRWKEGLINDDTLAQNITLGLEHVDQMWASYLSHHKRPEELPYIDYTAEQIEIIKRYFEEIRSLAFNHTSRTLSRWSPSQIIRRPSITRSQDSFPMKQLLLDTSVLFLSSHHQNSLMQLAVMLVVILLGVLTFAWRIFMQIEQQQQQLLDIITSSKTS